MLTLCQRVRWGHSTPVSTFDRKLEESRVRVRLRQQTYLKDASIEGTTESDLNVPYNLRS